MSLRIAFVLEHSLGHATHAQNLKRVLAAPDAGGVEPAFIDLAYDDLSRPWQRLPLLRSNWSVRASLGAYRALRCLPGRIDGALFHTQVTSLFSAGLMRSIPSVVSLDATPLQIDAQGEQYGHRPSGDARLEAFKMRLNRRAFAAARHLVTWSDWAKRSLVSEYGVEGDKVTVIPPGVDKDAWTFAERDTASDRPVRFLFVGGDFARKGGDTLLEAFQALPPAIRSRSRLDIVTKTPGAGEGIDGVTVHRGLTPNSAELRALYAGADAFAFPTRGDCLPLAVLEALMAGLPVLTTDVGALPEAVGGGEAGRVIPAGDPAALAAAMAALAGDAALRRALGRRARGIAEDRFDAATNYRRLVGLVKGVAEGSVGLESSAAAATAPRRRRVA